MCGRYTLKNPERLERDLARLFEISAKLAARFNVAPSQTLPVVVRPVDRPAAVAELRWGFLPPWEQGAKPAILPINAQIETVAQKPMFRAALRERRCLVPADGFYEWRKDADGGKTPFHIERVGSEPFYLAGIWQPARGPHPGTFAVLTTRPNALMEPIHRRMPVLLTGERARDWVATPSPDEAMLADYATPYVAEDMQALVVSRLVNSPRHDDPECVAPRGADDEPTGSELGPLFQR